MPTGIRPDSSKHRRSAIRPARPAMSVRASICSTPAFVSDSRFHILHERGGFGRPTFFRQGGSMKAIRLCSLFTVLFALSAGAQVSPRYADWANGPVTHLMTKEEIKQWKAVRTDDEARAFIDLFWARRDPTPDTPRNEFREQFEQMVRVADENF